MLRLPSEKASLSNTPLFTGKKNIFVIFPAEFFLAVIFRNCYYEKINNMRWLTSRALEHTIMSAPTMLLLNDVTGPLCVLQGRSSGYCHLQLTVIVAGKPLQKKRPAYPDRYRNWHFTCCQSPFGYVCHNLYGRWYCLIIQGCCTQSTALQSWPTMEFQVTKV